MNRKIIFRGRRQDNGEWVYGNLTDNLFGEPLIEYRVEPRGELGIKGQERIKVIPETVGQFTGEMDIEKKEIYEDDIIQYRPEDARRVIFSGYSFGILNADNSFGSYHTWRQGIVIGNIFDNPELIKSK